MHATLNLLLNSDAGPYIAAFGAPVMVFAAWWLAFRLFRVTEDGE